MNATVEQPIHQKWLRIAHWLNVLALDFLLGHSLAREYPAHFYGLSVF
jgi:hypothetical protein